MARYGTVGCREAKYAVCAAPRIVILSYLMAKRKNPAAVALGRKGGKTTAKRLTAAERSASAKKAAAARWGKKGK